MAGSSGGLLWILVGIVVSAYCGWRLVKLACRAAPTAPPGLPQAKIANPEADERLYAKTASAASAAGSVGRGLWRPFVFLTGMGLMFGPTGYILWLLKDFRIPNGGRALRIRRRLRVAESARGEGWHDDTATASLGRGESAEARRVLGAHWLRSARMEHASVPAFAQLSLHLAALGAPAHLIAATHHAALDEIRHAQACFAIARALTGEPHTAGVLPALAKADGRPIDHRRLAVESLIDGCLAEGIAADVAAHDAAHTREPVIAQTLTMIAGDEAGHAELAWDVLTWCLAVGGETVRAAVNARLAVLDREPTPRMPALPGVDARARRDYGVIEQAALDAITTARIAAVRSRGRAVLGTASPAMDLARAA